MTSLNDEFLAPKYKTNFPPQVASGQSVLSQEYNETKTLSMHEALGVIRRAHKSTHTQKWMWWQRQEDQEIEITLSYIEEFKPF